jgi:hypothetical protein
MKDNAIVFAIIIIASILFFSVFDDSNPKKSTSDLEQGGTIELNETDLEDKSVQGLDDYELISGEYTILETIIYDDLIELF